MRYRPHRGLETLILKVSLEYAITPVILVTHKQQSETWSVGSLQTIGMAKGIEREHFAHSARRLAHVTQQNLEAQLLS
jgi:hypothetical protein